MSSDDPVARAAVEAIRAGDVSRLARMLAEHPWLATARLGQPASGSQSNDGSAGDTLSGGCAAQGCREWRSLLHVLTDWPGHCPRGAESVAVLVAAGAEVDACFEGAHQERPLHWAASCDDVPVLDALLDHGADIEAAGAVIGGGSALADAVAFGQWNAARRLVERGAAANLWQSAALGLLEQVRAQCPPTKPTSPADRNTSSEVTKAFWCACHGGQLETARYLLECGADPHWIGYDHLTPLAAARRSQAHVLVGWLEQLERDGR